MIHVKLDITASRQAAAVALFKYALKLIDIKQPLPLKPMITENGESRMEFSARPAKRSRV